MEYFCEINENLTDKKLSGMDPNLVKRVVLKHVVDNGYIKGSYGYHNNNGTSYRGSPTVAEIVSILDQEVDESRLADEKFSQEMESWINSLQPAGNFAEYQQKIKDTWGKNYFVRSDLGMLCSAVNSFLKDKEYKQRQQDKADRQQAHQEKVASDSNRWAGDVGDEIEFVVKDANVATYIQPHYYNAPSYPLWKIIDTDGLTYSWGDTSGAVEVVPGMKINAKIKRLNEFRGVKETQIWRVRTQFKNRSFFSEGKEL